MSRYLPLMALIALPVLIAGCDSPTAGPLSNAKTGECYAVAGRDGKGPKLVKAPCASSTALAAAACPAPSVAATCAPAAGHKATGSRKSHTVRQASHKAVRFHRQARAHTRSNVAHSGERVRSLGIEYARVGDDLLGGPSGHGETYQREAYREDHREYRRDLPPPRHHVERGEVLDYSSRESERRAYSYSESSSSSGYRSSGYSSGKRKGGCDCDGPDAGPHSPFDGNGYLTWRGKTPG